MSAEGLYKRLAWGDVKVTGVCAFYQVKCNRWEGRSRNSAVIVDIIMHSGDFFVHSELGSCTLFDA